MEGLVVVIIVFFVLTLIVKASGGALTGGYDKIIATGIPARGIFLAVSPTPTRTVGSFGRRFQVRRVRIDIEVPGEAPYELDCSPYIPMNLVADVLPGATVELRLDRTNRTNIAIVGPGVGFAGFVNQTIVAQAPATQPAVNQPNQRAS